VYLLETLQQPVVQIRDFVTRPGSAANLADAKQSLERQKIKEILDKTRGNKSEAARLMGITRTTLYQKLQKYQLGV